MAGIAKAVHGTVGVRVKGEAHALAHFPEGTNRAMPESRRRKPKKVSTQTGKPKAATKQATTAQPKRRWAKGRRVIVIIFSLFVGAVGLFAAAVGIVNE